MERETSVGTQRPTHHEGARSAMAAPPRKAAPYEGRRAGPIPFREKIREEKRPLLGALRGNWRYTNDCFAISAKIR